MNGLIENDMALHKELHKFIIRKIKKYTGEGLITQESLEIIEEREAKELNDRLEVMSKW